MKHTWYIIYGMMCCLFLSYNSSLAVSLTKKTQVFAYVEQMPSFPGGETALMKYIAENLRYPSVSKDQGIQGLVIIKFVVTDTGNVGEIQIVKSLDPNCDREALRLVKTLPKFHPGRHQGKPVNVWYQIPIRFMIK